MAKWDFEHAFRVVVGDEGAYSNDKNDPGGETRFGIDQASWAETQQRLPTDVRAAMPAHVRDLTFSQAEEVYLYAFWLHFQCNGFPPPLAFALFDAAVNPGPGWAPRALQSALNVTVDGDIGPETLAAARRADPAEVLAEFTRLRVLHYWQQETFATFGKGLLLRSYRTVFVAGMLAA